MVVIGFISRAGHKVDRITGLLNHTGTSVWSTAD